MIEICIFYQMRIFVIWIYEERPLLFFIIFKHPMGPELSRVKSKFTIRLSWTLIISASPEFIYLFERGRIRMATVMFDYYY
jgi:hypothetical protein